MKISSIATMNTKGQIVIPQAIRKQLGITSNSPLHIVFNGKNIQIFPIQEIIYDKSEDSQAYQNLLKITQGSWAKSSSADTTKERIQRQIEVKASKKRKQAW